MLCSQSPARRVDPGSTQTWTVASSDREFRVRGVVRLGTRSRVIQSVAFVSTSEIVLDSGACWLHLPRSSPQVVVSNGELKATVPTFGWAHFVPWRHGRWAEVLRQTGWLEPS